jgi:trimeric autotransporter adhesin
MLSTFRIGTLLRALFALLTCTYAIGASAACTTNLVQAIGQWTVSDPSTTTTLRLEQGTYPITADSGGFGNPVKGGPLIILGGYIKGHDCSDNFRSRDASTTVLDGGGGNSVFSLVVSKSVQVTVVTFKNFRGFGVLFEGTNSDASVTIDHVIGVGNSQLQFIGGGNTILRDVLVYNQPNSSNHDIAALLIDSIHDASTATNLTVVDNAGPGVDLRSLEGKGSSISIYNSIIAKNLFEQNFIYDFTHNTNKPHVSYLITDNDESSAEGFVQDHAQFVDAKFVDPANHNYHLQYAPPIISPGIDAGTTSVPNGLPGTDIEGHARTHGSQVDLGAYETNVPYSGSYVVTSMADNGNNTSPTANTLRWAVVSAKHAAASAGSGVHTYLIAFDLPNGPACPNVIALNTAAAMPSIDFDLVVDGETQAKWTPNTSYTGFDANLCVGINGRGTLANAFHTVGNGHLVVKGIAFGGFADAAVRLDAGSGNQLTGNQFGNLCMGGTQFCSNKDGVHISGTSDASWVGTFDDPSTRNYIVDNTSNGIYIENDSGDNYVVNNLIGLGADSINNTLGNGHGVYVYQSPQNYIGYNTIDNSVNAGLTLNGAPATLNIVQYNRIGRPETGNGDSSNGVQAILVTGGALFNTIGAGANESGGGNLISSDDEGIYLAPTAGIGNRVLGNEIASVDLAIDLGVMGPTPNDSGDNDSGPNKMQNYPLISHAYATATTIWIEGDVYSIPLQSYRLDFYGGSCCNHGRGDPIHYYGHDASGVTDGSGHVHFWARLPKPSSMMGISATATSATGDTSETGDYAPMESDLIFRDDVETHG